VSDPATVQGAACAAAVLALVRAGVRDFVVAPGSRSTPLVAALARNPDARVTVLVDERVAAFFALGIGRATGRPAALVTTSGSAIAHAFPAVIEADADDVPLLLLSADRPAELRDTGANQTIDQVRLFGSRVRWFQDLPVPTLATGLRAWVGTFEEAVAQAVGAPAGPVHLNLQIRKPLEPPVGDARALLQASGWLDDPRSRRWLDAPVGATGPVGARRAALLPDDAETLRSLAAEPDGWLLIGGLATDRERGAARRIAAALGWVVHADVASGIAFEALPGAAPGLEPLLDGPARAWFRPRAALWIGGALVSARAQRHLLASEASVCVVQPHGRRRDPDHRADRRIVADLEAVADALEAYRTAEPPARTVSGATEPCATAASLAAAAIRAHVGDAGEAFADELGVVAGVIDGLPADADLILAASMPVRDVDAFGPAWARAVGRSGPSRVFTARGASGIDGTIATAMGVAHASGGPVVVVCGDLALQHDLGGAFALAATALPVTIVLVDNGGGGIFHFLPVADEADLLEPYVAAGHQRDLGAALRGCGLAVDAIRGPAALAAALAAPPAPPTPRVLHVRTERVANAAGHRALHARIAATVARAFS
jgi:2-succinyl-5-enolpyruvyl-6-hydroxy-3-cyclohexene-1-carboxylate synthase